MVKVTKRFSGGPDPQQWAQDIISTIESRNRESMANAIKEGSSLMKEYISTRGIGKLGRIETARMVGAVNSVVRERTRDKWLGAFGWVNDTADYFHFQEEGFRHVWTGTEIPGMYAKADAAAQAWETLTAEIRKNVNDA